MSARDSLAAPARNNLRLLGGHLRLQDLSVVLHGLNMGFGAVVLRSRGGHGDVGVLGRKCTGRHVYRNNRR